MFGEFLEFVERLLSYPRADRASANVVTLYDGFVALWWLLGVCFLDRFVIDAGQAHFVFFGEFAHVSVSKS